ncbi:MAG TPA: VOC family protein [Thermoplasmata archaeon]|nr:VOC family protein [Thermoplasmata archaeon]
MAHHARMAHAELISKDPAATQKFLEKAFGLKFDVMGPEMGHYRMHRGQANSAPNAAAGDIGIRGLMGPSEHPGTVSYLTIPDIDEALKAVKEAGAKVIMDKTEIPTVGFSAIYIAPGEVTLGLFQFNRPA